MKRPQGFDGAATGREEPARAKSVQKVRGIREKATPAAGSSTPKTPSSAKARRGPHESPALAEPPGSGKRLRATTRERHRFEKREIRRFTRRTRHRRLAWTAAFGVIVLLGGLLAVAVYSPLLALRSIAVDGVSKVGADDVRDAVSGQLGVPLALLDYGVIQTELDSFPLIRSFSTEIVPPSTMRIHIVERVPIGVLASSAGFEIVDPAGVVLESAPRRPEGIPLIDLAGDDTDSVAFAAVVDVLLALPDSIRPRVDLAQATSKDDVRLVLVDAGQRVRWGSAERSALKARVLAELMAAQGDGANVEFDVSAPMSPVVRSH